MVAASVQIYTGTTVKLNEFLPWKNEETVGDFLTSIVEDTAELKYLLVDVIKAKNITCCFDISMGVLLPRNLFDLDVNMIPIIKGKATNSKNCFTYMMKMAKQKIFSPNEGYTLFLLILHKTNKC